MSSDQSPLQSKRPRLQSASQNFDFRALWEHRKSKNSLSDDDRKEIVNYFTDEIIAGTTMARLYGNYGRCCAAADWLKNPPHNMECKIEKFHGTVKNDKIYVMDREYFTYSENASAYSITIKWDEGEEDK